jgi:DNA polymerase bacteriophage-type
MLRMAAVDQIGRGMLLFWGAGTGRWTALIVQLHNFPRPIKGVDVRAALAAIRGGSLSNLKLCGVAKDGLPAACDPMGALMSCLRSCLRARRGRRFVAFDYNAIECRGIFWLAQEQAGLDLFYKSDSGKGPEIYLVAGGRIFKVPPEQVTEDQRKVAKEQVLGCGYQMGHPTFAVRCKQSGVDLAKAGVTAQQIVEGYRKQFPAVVRYWRRLQDASVAALRTAKPIAVGRVIFLYDQKREVLRVCLPSGRYIAYRKPSIVRDPKFGTLQMRYWDPTGRPLKEEAIVLRKAGKPIPKRGWWVRTYGGMLAENICQAVCRDLLADALVRVEAAGLQVALHVHDEIVVECDTEDVAQVDAQLKALMSMVPPWAAGFPIKVKGWTDRRFKKD